MCYRDADVQRLDVCYSYWLVDGLAWDAVVAYPVPVSVLMVTGTASCSQLSVVELELLGVASVQQFSEPAASVNYYDDFLHYVAMLMDDFGADFDFDCVFD